MILTRNQQICGVFPSALRGLEGEKPLRPTASALQEGFVLFDALCFSFLQAFEFKTNPRPRK